MRILHINGNYIYTNLHQTMIEHLEKRGIHNKVFVPVYKNANSVVNINKDVEICECFNKIDRFVFDYKQRKISKALEKNISVKNYDLVHAYTLFTDGNCARKMFRKYHIPYVVAIRNTDVNTFFCLRPHLRNRGIKIMLDAKEVIFLSESYRKQVFEKYIPSKYHDAIKKKTHIIPNGIDDYWFNNMSDMEHTLDDTIKLIYAGRIDRNKNIITTQKAMKILRNKGYNVSLSVVGKIADKKVFKIIKKDLTTHYYGVKQKEELISLYRSHDIFVMPSLTESFGLVYAEAMSQGLPVIYTRGQGFDEHFLNGVVGYAVNAMDENEVAENIVRILNDYKEKRVNCLRNVTAFKWDYICELYDNVYNFKV